MPRLALAMWSLALVLLTTSRPAEAQRHDCIAWGLDKPDQLHCFFPGGNAQNHLWHKGWWNGSWYTWQDLGSPPAVPIQDNRATDCLAWGPSKPDQLHCFLMLDDGRLWHIGWWNGSWQPWQDLGMPAPSQGGAGSAPSCVAWGPLKPDQLHCFVRGPGGKMYHKGWWSGAWQAWEDLGRPAGKNVSSRGPRCLAWGPEIPDQLHCFTMVSDENDPAEKNPTLWHRGWWSGAWHGWESFGQPPTATLTSQPECVVWGLDKPNQLHCFARSDDKGKERLWHVWWANGSWYGWEDLGVPPLVPSNILSQHPPSCVAWGPAKPDQLHCFMVFNETLWHRGWWDGAWHAWQKMGVTGAGGPRCLAWDVHDPNQLHCFIITTLGGGYSGTLWTIGWWDGGWHAWQNLGHP